MIEDFTTSDHQYITFRVRDGMPARAAAQSAPPSPWCNVRKMDTERLYLDLERGQPTPAETEGGAASPARAEVVTSMTMRLIYQASAEAIPRSRIHDGRLPAY